MGSPLNHQGNEEVGGERKTKAAQTDEKGGGERRRLLKKQVEAAERGACREPMPARGGGSAARRGPAGQ